MFGPHHLGGPELLFDDEQLERVRVAAPRCGPARRDVALGRESRPLFERRQGLDLLEQRTQLAAMRFGFGRQVDREAAARATHRGPSGAHPPVVGAAGELAQGDGAPEVDVRVVLPREADAAEGLHAVLGVGEGGVERERCRGGDRERGAGIVEVVGRARRVPDRRRAPARAGPASRRSDASRPGTDRSAGRTARAPSRTPTRCRRTTARSRSPPPRTAPRRWSVLDRS